MLPAGSIAGLDIAVWIAPRQEPVRLGNAIAGDGFALLCFYPFNWSPTCTNEVLLLDERRAELASASVRPFGISCDSPWSHAAWTDALGLRVPLLSDWNREATRAFGVADERRGMTDVPLRSAFLLEGDTVRAAWALGRDLPDVDAVIAAATSASP